MGGEPIRTSNANEASDVGLLAESQERQKLKRVAVVLPVATLSASAQRDYVVGVLARTRGYLRASHDVSGLKTHARAPAHTTPSL